MITLQQAFDNAWKGIQQQGGYAYDEERSACYYRMTNGRKCAIGWSLPDDLYTKAFEQQGPRGIYNATGLFSLADIPALEALQGLHDGAAREEASLDAWKASMREFAREHNLTIPEEAA